MWLLSRFRPKVPIDGHRTCWQRVAITAMETSAKCIALPILLRLICLSRPTHTHSSCFLTITSTTVQTVTNTTIAVIAATIRMGVVYKSVIGAIIPICRFRLRRIVGCYRVGIFCWRNQIFGVEIIGVDPTNWADVSDIYHQLHNTMLIYALVKIKDTS